MELFYKNYRTNVAYDEEEKYYYGKLEGIADFVNFGTENLDKIVEEFHSAVDDYLEYCAEIGKVPKLAVKPKYNLEINSDLYNSIKIAAKHSGENVENFIEKILADYLSKTA